VLFYRHKIGGVKANRDREGEREREEFLWKFMQMRIKNNDCDGGIERKKREKFSSSQCQHYSNYLRQRSHNYRMQMEELSSILT
jgi:hypothetical protein